MKRMVSSTEADNAADRFGCLVPLALLFVDFIWFSFRLYSAAGSTRLTYEHLIPSGGWFEKISCPHYFSEIVIYIGLVMITLFDTAFLIILLWVFVNQVIAGKMSHDWYLKEFREKYPRHRKAIFPCLL